MTIFTIELDGQKNKTKNEKNKQKLDGQLYLRTQKTVSEDNSLDPRPTECQHLRGREQKEVLQDLSSRTKNPQEVTIKCSGPV